MTDRTRRRSSRRRRGTASVGLVLALAGLLFTANARLARGQEERHPQNLSDLAVVESARVKALAAQVDGLRSQVDTLTAAQAAGVDTGDAVQSRRIALAAGRTAVSGPGVTVRLTDATSTAPRSAQIGPDDLVVHQQDVQAVVNALWAGGAEAMALQDQRVTSTTAFSCVGNVLALGGRVYSPPYEIRAIGDAHALRAALYGSDAIQRYLSYVADVGLGWSVTTASAAEPLNLPGTGGGTQLLFAGVPAGVDVFPGAGAPS